MYRETIYGKFKGVNFYGVGQLTFLHWCHCQDIKVENNDVQLKAKNPKLSTKPIFFLPDYDLRVDIRPRKNENSRLAAHTHRVNTAVAENHSNFIFLYQEKLNQLLGLAHIKHMDEDSEVDLQLAGNVRARLEMFKVPDEKLPLVGMPRWFRERLREIRKSRSNTAA